jgi:hypothetical protein
VTLVVGAADTLAVWRDLGATIVPLARRGGHTICGTAPAGAYPLARSRRAPHLQAFAVMGGHSAVL